MNQTVFIPEFDEQQMTTGYIWVTKRDEKGDERGLMPVSEVADVMREFVNWESAGRTVTIFSRFTDSPFLAWGQNGGKWVVVREIKPAEYYLVSTSGSAYTVNLPRLIVKVCNYEWPFFFWAEDGVEPSPDMEIYPLLLGNVYGTGRVCLGTTGLKCSSMDDIEQFVRQVIEAPSTHMLSGWAPVDPLYERLTKGWDHSVGRKNKTTLKKLIDQAM